MSNIKEITNFLHCGQRGGILAAGEKVIQLPQNRRAFGFLLCYTASIERSNEVIKMDYMTLIWSICVLAENSAKSEIDLTELAKQTGFSVAHIRDVFRQRTGKPLMHYVQERKIANAAQELLHCSDDIIEVAMRFGYSSRDVFSRVFKRYTGYTPSEFRKVRPACTRVRLCAGVFGAALPQKEGKK